MNGEISDDFDPLTRAASFQDTGFNAPQSGGGQRLNQAKDFITLSSMTIAEFVNSPVGTVATFLLTTNPGSRQWVSNSITSACTRKRCSCVLKRTAILVEQDDGSWFPSSTLSATIIKRPDSENSSAPQLRDRDDSPVAPLDQRNQLLATLKSAREWIDDCGAQGGVQLMLDEIDAAIAAAGGAA